MFKATLLKDWQNSKTKLFKLVPFLVLVLWIFHFLLVCCSMFHSCGFYPLFFKLCCLFFAITPLFVFTWKIKQISFFVPSLPFLFPQNEPYCCFFLDVSNFPELFKKDQRCGAIMSLSSCGWGHFGSNWCYNFVLPVLNDSKSRIKRMETESKYINNQSLMLNSRRLQTLQHMKIFKTKYWFKAPIDFITCYFSLYVLNLY